MIKSLQNSSFSFKGSNMADINSNMSPLLKQRLEAQGLSNASQAAFEKDSVEIKKEKPSLKDNLKNKLSARKEEKAQKKAQKEAQKEEIKPEKKEKVPFFNRILNGVKKLNSNVKTSVGWAKGLAIATPTFVGLSVVGKNIQEKRKDGVEAILHGVITDVSAGIKHGKNFINGIKLDNQKAKEIKKAIAEGTQEATKTKLKDNVVVKNALKALSTPARFGKYLGKTGALAGAVAFVAGAGIVAYNVVKAKINANKQNSNIDHTFYTEHKIK